MKFKAQRSAHTITHPHEALVTCGDGWGGGVYMTSMELLDAAELLLRLAREVERESNPRR